MDKNCLSKKCPVKYANSEINFLNYNTYLTAGEAVGGLIISGKGAEDQRAATLPERLKKFDIITL